MRPTSFTQFETLPIKVALRAGISMSEMVGILQSSNIGYHEALREFQKRWIIRVLEICGGKHSDAAAVLEIHRNTLTRLKTELKIDSRCGHARAPRRNKLAARSMRVSAGTTQLAGTGELRLVNSNERRSGDFERPEPADGVTKFIQTVRPSLSAERLPDPEEVSR